MNGEDKTKPGLLDALRSVKKLLADNEDTAQVFTILEALGKRATKRAWRKFSRLPQADTILAQPDLIHLLQDREKLAAMPEGSLGRRYYEFMAHENITADGLVAASEDGLSGKREFTPLEEKFHLRQRDSHDLWHVVTGYGRDQLGELALLAVYYRQISNPGFMMIVLFGARAGRKEYPGIGIWAAIREGLRHGRQMDWLPGIAWEDYMDMPLEEVRTKLNIAAPVKYHQARAKMREMNSDYQAQAAE
ncbi:MAG: Coq4 family protein [Parvibaculales bacterium]